MMDCQICGTNAPFWAQAKILKKYDVSYYQCPNCGFVQTEKPYWLAEAYSEIIDAEDIGLLKRNIDNAAVVSRLVQV